MAENEWKEEAAVSLPELERLCPECEGDTDYNSNPCGPWCPCGCCGGAGFRPTAFGHKVLALVRRNIVLDAETGSISWR